MLAPSLALLLPLLCSRHLSYSYCQRPDQHFCCLLPQAADQNDALSRLIKLDRYISTPQASPQSAPRLLVAQPPVLPGRWHSAGAAAAGFGSRPLRRQPAHRPFGRCSERRGGENAPALWLLQHIGGDRSSEGLRKAMQTHAASSYRSTIQDGVSRHIHVKSCTMEDLNSKKHSPRQATALRHRQHEECYPYR